MDNTSSKMEEEKRKKLEGMGCYQRLCSPSSCITFKRLHRYRESLRGIRKDSGLYDIERAL